MTKVKYLGTCRGEDDTLCHDFRGTDRDDCYTFSVYKVEDGGLYMFYYEPVEIELVVDELSSFFHPKSDFFQQVKDIFGLSARWIVLDMSWGSIRITKDNCKPEQILATHDLQWQFWQIEKELEKIWGRLTKVWKDMNAMKDKEEVQKKEKKS